MPIIDIPSLEELIYQQLIFDPVMVEKLTTFGGKPAVFEISVPPDTDKGWIKNKQYPRIAYSVDKQENPERKVNGTMVLDIATQGDIEVLEERAREILSNVFFETSDGTYALVWNQSPVFEEEDNVIGVTMTFDLFAFPSQMTTTPDPVAGMISRTATIWPSAYLFDSSQGPVWKPTVDSPAVYWRVTSLARETPTNAVIWISVTIQGHIFAPNSSDRIKLLRALVENLSIQDRVNLSDDSPLFIQNISADSGKDPLREGQITLNARYGILRTKPSAPELTNINFEGGI